MLDLPHAHVRGQGTRCANAHLGRRVPLLGARHRGERHAEEAALVVADRQTALDEGLAILDDDGRTPANHVPDEDEIGGADSHATGPTADNVVRRTIS